MPERTSQVTDTCHRGVALQRYLLGVHPGKRAQQQRLKQAYLGFSPIELDNLDAKKKTCNFRHRSYLLDGAQEKTRTSTMLPSPAPEAGASTNFATWAQASIL